jgi:hypothetical protein
MPKFFRIPPFKGKIMMGFHIAMLLNFIFKYFKKRLIYSLSARRLTNAINILIRNLKMLDFSKSIKYIVQAQENFVDIWVRWKLGPLRARESSQAILKKFPRA